MHVSKIVVEVKVKHMWLIKVINIVPVLLGFKGYVPNFCISVSSPKRVETCKNVT